MAKSRRWVIFRTEHNCCCQASAAAPAERDVGFLVAVAVDAASGKRDRGDEYAGCKDVVDRISSHGSDRVCGRAVEVRQKLFGESVLHCIFESELGPKALPVDRVSRTSAVFEGV